jgi:hypothetical protein
MRCDPGGFKQARGRSARPRVLRAVLATALILAAPLTVVVNAGAALAPLWDRQLRSSGDDADDPECGRRDSILG